MLKNYQKKELIGYITGSVKNSHLSDADHASYDALQEKILTGYPFEYVVQSCDFLGCKLFVNEDVLIPRLETELLAETVVQYVQEQKTHQNVLDLCTGSGALGISIKKHTSASVVLSDICPKALAIAKKNAEVNHCQIAIKQGNLFENLKGEKFDIVVCNPPYVTNEEYPLLEDSVKKYEPKLALVGGEAGVDFYKIIANDIVSFLNKGAKIFFEIGSSQGQQIEAIFSMPHFTNCRIQKDYSGHDRFFFLEFQPL